MAAHAVAVAAPGRPPARRALPPRRAVRRPRRGTEVARVLCRVPVPKSVTEGVGGRSLLLPLGVDAHKERRVIPYHSASGHLAALHVGHGHLGAPQGVGHVLLRKVERPAPTAKLILRSALQRFHYHANRFTIYVRKTLYFSVTFKGTLEMPFALQAMDRKIIAAALKFANLRRITSTEQVERLFAETRSPRFRSLQEHPQGPLILLSLWGVLREWLQWIPLLSQADKQVVAEHVAEFLGEAVHVELKLEGGELRYEYQVDDLRAGCVLAMALLFSKREKLTNRLKQCGWCGRFNLEFDPKGRPRRFCRGHKEKYDLETAAERVKRHRAGKGS